MAQIPGAGVPGDQLRDRLPHDGGHDGRAFKACRHDQAGQRGFPEDGLIVVGVYGEAVTQPRRMETGFSAGKKRRTFFRIFRQCSMEVQSCPASSTAVWGLVVSARRMLP